MSPLSVTVELHLFGLIGTANCSDMQKIRIIGFFFDNRLHWQFEGEIIPTNGCFRLHTYLRTNKTAIQGVYKRMVRFQKLTRNLFLTLHGQNVRRQQRQLSKFLMRYQQFASHA